MSTHNICFYEELAKIFLELSSKTLPLYVVRKTAYDLHSRGFIRLTYFYLTIFIPPGKVIILAMVILLFLH